MQHVGPADVDMAMGMMILMVLVFTVVGALLTVLPFWFICKKAGLHGALSLLMLVPIANIVLPVVIPEKSRADKTYVLAYA